MYFLAMVALQIYVQLSLGLMEVQPLSLGSRPRLVTVNLSIPGYQSTIFDDVSDPSTRMVKVRS